MSNKKAVKITSDTYHTPRRWDVYKTDNGFQWWPVFNGDLSQAKIIANAYQSIGYKLTK